MRKQRTTFVRRSVEGVPDNEDTTITATQALGICHEKGKKITIATLHKWIDPHLNPGIAYQPAGPGGRYYVRKLAFIRLIDGHQGE